MLSILIFIVVLGVLVFVHELGHFLTAKFHGIHSDEFGFGFPPRLAGVYKDEESGKYRIVWGSREVATKNTIYSLNWIPLGGFVKIKGEDGIDITEEKDSLAEKSAWVRIQVTVAGVVMNLIMAWVLIAIVLMIGLPQPIEDSEAGQYADARVQIMAVAPNTPAATMGIQPGDVIKKIDGTEITSVEQVGSYIKGHKGQDIAFEVNRFGKDLTLHGTPRTEVKEGEGALGISYSLTATVQHGFFQAIGKGFVTTWTITFAILGAFGDMIASLFGGTSSTAGDLTGPVGIVYLTKQMSDLGLAYLLQFAALLSINLAIINILPIPALDGGRILFILIEKIKGRPMNQRIENMIHQIGFTLLLLLMLFVTIKDLHTFKIFEKIGGLFT
ncbi:MAG: RIP metalloprotease RseP [Candidatus Moranbacteria bacterium]|nr:RIP metalloprotease RseP [Candidatus Moranbacteria bacterium]